MPGAPGSGRPVRRASGVAVDRNRLNTMRSEAEDASALGVLGEALVADAYQQQGYTVVARNWRCADGELDLILARHSTVVFCEVKTRSGTRFGTPAEAVTKEKRERIRALAAQWLAANRGTAKELRFDVAAVAARPGAETEIEITEGAF